MTTHTTTQSDAPFDSPINAPAVAATRPMYWSVRRELWEHRFIYVAPLVVTGFVLLGTLISLIGLAGRMETLSTLDPAKQHLVVVRPFNLAPAPIMFTTFLIGTFYALDALYGERRDRSILFWKSLPVSDLTTVLAKMSVPLVVLPLIAFVLSLATLVILLLVSTVVLLANSIGPARLWTEVRFVQEPVIMLYGLTVHVLWFSPLYCWLLLVSAWSRRTPLLWVVLPPVAIAVVERVAFGTSYLGSLLKYRLAGAMEEAFTAPPGGLLDQVSQLDPVRFLTSAGLWTGLACAAAFAAAAVRLRHNREPI